MCTKQVLQLMHGIRQVLNGRPVKQNLPLTVFQRGSQRPTYRISHLYGLFKPPRALPRARSLVPTPMSRSIGLQYTRTSHNWLGGGRPLSAFSFDRSKTFLADSETPRCSLKIFVFCDKVKALFKRHDGWRCYRYRGALA